MVMVKAKNKSDKNSKKYIIPIISRNKFGVNYYIY